jgi:hypothetical protein
VIGLLNKYQEKRKQQWLKINSFRQNERYMVKIFNKFELVEDDVSSNHKKNNTFKFNINSLGDYDVLVTTDLGKTYRIVINVDEFSYKILEESFALNRTHKPKYHEVKEIKTIQSDDGIIDCLRYLTGKDIGKDICVNN